jgi:hypothetical protein
MWYHFKSAEGIRSGLTRIPQGMIDDRTGTIQWFLNTYVFANEGPSPTIISHLFNKLAGEPLIHVWLCL